MIFILALSISQIGEIKTTFSFFVNDNWWHWYFLKQTNNKILPQGAILLIIFSIFRFNSFKFEQKMDVVI